MKIEQNKSLQSLNTFGIDARAAYFAEIQSIEDIHEILSLATFRYRRKLILGGGSNVLFSKDFDGLVIRVTIPGIKITERSGGHTVVHAGAGVLWDELVSWTLDQNLAGLENLSGIPGSVGAAPVQNIGAYGVELKDSFAELEAMDLASGALKKFTLDECKFGYRDSVFKRQFKHRYLITSVSFCLYDISGVHPALHSARHCEPKAKQSAFRGERLPRPPARFAGALARRAGEAGRPFGAPRNDVKQLYHVGCAHISAKNAGYQPKVDYGELKKIFERIESAQLSPKKIREAVLKIRKAKLPDPAELGNAGSFFKNPILSSETSAVLLKTYPEIPHYPEAAGIKIPAGWLIEQCGWKGKTIGKVGCHKDQALILVNFGGADGSEILGLAEKIRDSVQKRFGICLEPEVNIA
jgi:UDP-N-acetylmuramate dehydrogenase